MNPPDISKVPDDRGPDKPDLVDPSSLAPPGSSDLQAESNPPKDLTQPTPKLPEPDQAEPLPPEPAHGEADPQSLVMLWGALQTAIQQRVQPEQFETWFRRAALARVDSHSVVLAVSSGFTRTWIDDYYRSTIEQAIEAVLGVSRVLKITVDPEFLASKGVPTTGPSAVHPEPAPKQNNVGAANGGDAPSTNAPALRSAESQTSGSNPVQGGAGRTKGGLLKNSDVSLNPKYAFNNFVVGPCNRFGHAAAMGAAEQPGKSYNPFFLHGNVGVGKTHLLQGLCYMILEREPDSRILYLSCETFVNHFISALENGDLTRFRNKYRNVDVLVVDDIHLLANKDHTQEEFFHTFNTLYQAGKQIVLSSDSPPKDIPTLQNRLVSRFRWGMVTEIEPPCFETRMAIVKRKSRDQGAEFPDEVVELIAENVENNVRELEGAVTRLIGYAGVTKNPLTIATAREALQDLFQVSRGEPTMEDVITVITSNYGVK